MPALYPYLFFLDICHFTLTFEAGGLIFDSL